MKNIKLRTINKGDTDIILKWRNSKAVVDNFIDRRPVTKDIHLNWYKTKIQTGKVVQFIAYDQLNKKNFASTYLKDIDKTHKKAEFGIFIGEDEYRSKGFGKIITKQTLNFGFKKLKLNKIYARVLTYNSPSYNMFKNLGFKQDALLREDVIIKNKKYDVYIMSILKSDYKNR